MCAKSKGKASNTETKIAFRKVSSCQLQEKTAECVVHLAWLFLAHRHFQSKVPGCNCGHLWP